MLPVSALSDVLAPGWTTVREAALLPPGPGLPLLSLL